MLDVTINMPPLTGLPFEVTRSSKTRSAVWHNDTFGGLPVASRRQRLVGLFKRKSIGDHRSERKLLARLTEQLNGHAQVARFAGPGAEHFKLLARDDLRVERHRAGVAIMSEHQVFSAVATHLHSFGDG